MLANPFIWIALSFSEALKLKDRSRGSLLKTYRGGAWDLPSNIPILCAVGWAHKLHVGDLLKCFPSAPPGLLQLLPSL